MSATSDRKDALSIARDIRKDGTLIVFREISEGEYNPETEQSEKITTDYATFGVWTTVSAKEVIEGGIFQSGDATVLLSAFLLDGTPLPPPRITDRIVRDGVDLDIISVEPLRPGSVPVTYTIAVRDTGEAIA